MHRCLRAFWVMSLVIAGLATTGANAATDGNGRMLWGADFSGTVYSIDPTSGDREAAFQFEFQGPVPRAIHDLTYNPDSSRVVGVTGGSLYGDPVVFFQFDPFAASPTPEILGTYQPTQPTTQYVSGLAMDGLGNLFASETDSLDNRLVQVDPSSLAVLNVYDLPDPANFNVLDLATGAQPGRIFALHGSSELIFSIGTPGGPVETIGTFEQVGFSNAMAYDPWGDRFFISDTRLHEIDPVTGETIRILSDDSYSALTMVPEPSSALLVLAGVVAFAVGRGRGVMGLIQARSASEWISS